MNKIGIDTNIFIYTLDSSSPFYKKCKKFLKHSDYDFFTTVKNLSEFISVCTKLGVDRDKMNGFYSDIKNNVTILYPNKDSLEIFEQLNEKYKPKGNRVFDIEIVSVLTCYNIRKIASLNVKDFKDITEIELIEINNY